MMLGILLLLLIILRLAYDANSISCLTSNTCNPYPVFGRVGFAAKIIDILETPPGYTPAGYYAERNVLGAQQLLAFKLAVNYVNYLSMNDPLYGDIDGDGILGDFYIHPVVYKGEPLFNFLYYQHPANQYFDGAYGAYFLNLIKDELSGVIAAQDDDDTVESMMSTFKGWALPTFIVKSQSTQFSHASKYPYKARLLPADNFQAIILHEVLESYSWKRVAVFYTDDTDGIDCYINFKRSAPDYNVEILYVAHTAVTVTDYSIYIQDIIKSGATIIILFMKNDQQSKLLAQAYTLGLLNDKIQIIGATYSKDTTSLKDYLSGNSNKKDILKGYLSINWESRARFHTQAGQKFIQMMKTGSVDGMNIMSYPHGFQDPNAATSVNFANDGTNNMWFSKCKQWVFDGSTNYGPNIKDLNDGTAANSYCGTPGACDGKQMSGCSPNCPSFIPQNSCDLKYTKLCDDFDANFNPLWATICDEGSPLCAPDYPADKLAPTYPTLDAGMCLGLTRTELDDIANDIDPSTMFIFDAVVLNYRTAIMSIKQAIADPQFGPLPNTPQLQKDWNAVLREKLAYKFDTLISTFKMQGKKKTDTLQGMFTGDIEMDVGYEDEDNFMFGDRVSGFVYSMNNYDETTDELKISGYYDPDTKSYKNCTESGILKVLGEDFPCTKPRYRSSTVPDDMQPNEYVSMSKPMKSALYVFGILLLIVSIVWAVLIAINWNHKSLKMRQKYVLLFIILALFLGSFKVIITATWNITEGYCTADYWLGHLSFRLMALPIAYKLWRVDKLFNNTTLKRVKVTESQVIHRIIFFTTILIVVLFLHSGLSGPKIMARTFLKDNQLHITPFCGLGSYTLYSGAGRALHYLIFANQVFVLALALWYTFRTLNVPPVVNEASTISPSLVLLSIASAITCAILISYNVDPIISSFVIDTLFGLGGIFGSALYFTVVFYQIYKAHTKTSKKHEVSEKGKADNVQSTATIKSAIIPIDEHLDDLAFNVSQALLRRAKGNEDKAMVCQNQIQFWRGQMLVIAEKDEYSTKQSSSSSSVFVTDDDCDSSSIYSNEDITTTSSSTIVKEV